MEKDKFDKEKLHHKEKSRRGFFKLEERSDRSTLNEFKKKKEKKLNKQYSRNSGLLNPNSA